MLSGKWRYVEIAFAFLFGEMKTFKKSDDDRVKWQLISLLIKLDIKSARKLIAEL